MNWWRWSQIRPWIWARIRTKSIIRALNCNLRHAGGRYGESCTLTKQVRDCLDFWVWNLTTARWDYKITTVKICVYTEASMQGWGYYEQARQLYYCEQWDEHISGDIY